MGRKPVAKSDGVEIVGDSFRIRFMWNGRRCCETLAYPQTPQGRQAAASLRSTVSQLNKLGMLTEQKYAELFPTSSYVARNQIKHQTFGMFAQEYLNGLRATPRTRRNYRSLLNHHWMPKLATVPLDQITPLMLQKIVNEGKFSSDHNLAEAIDQLRRTLNSAVDLDLLERNPAKKLKKPKLARKNIDPFSAEEAEAIIDYLYADPELEAYGAYYELAFHTGMRPAEIAALRWDEVDLRKRTAYVCRIVAERKIAERVKNKVPRFVLLNPRAMHALKEARRIQKERARQALKFADTPFVFADPRGLNPFITSPEITDKVFQQTLAVLGVRARPQYNTRHTYASRCLMAGMNPGFIAKQLGHSEKMMFDHYATWIDGQADWQEMAKLYGAENDPEKGQNGTKVVREKTENP